MNNNEFRKYAIKHKGISSLAVDAYIESSIEDMTRTVIEERPMNFREIDVFSRLMADRIIFLGCPQRYSNVYQLTRWFGICRIGYL